MDFTFTSEERLLDDTVSRLVRDHWAFDRRLTKSIGLNGFSAETWTLMADLGLLAVAIPPADGGMGGGGTGLMILHRAFGRGLSPEPYLATAVLGAGIVAHLGSAEQRALILPNVMAGRLLLGRACLEPSSSYNPLWIETRAVCEEGAGYSISGHKAVVLNGDSADKLVIIARTSGKVDDRNGVSAFLVDVASPGVTVRGYPTIDGRRAAEVHLAQVRVNAEARLGAEGAAADALELVFATGCTALCAEAVGAMEVACNLTLEHLKTRRQFGVPIGKFQVLQHRMVDMHIAFEKAHSMTILATCGLDLPPREHERRVSAAKSLIGRSGRFIAEQAIQMHGGMGMTEEAAISHYSKRLVMTDHWLGDADYHLKRFAALGTRPMTFGILGNGAAA